jgi:hypothetical protein
MRAALLLTKLGDLQGQRREPSPFLPRTQRNVTHENAN